MTLSLIEKIGIIFKYTFSSFLSIEMLILTLLLFCVLIYNLKRKNQLVQMLSLGVYLGFVIGIIISYGAYVQTSVNSFVKAILNYIYFPSTVVYFFILVFVTIMILYTLFSKKITDFKKIINFYNFLFRHQNFIYIILNIHKCFGICKFNKFIFKSIITVNSTFK